MIGPKFTYNDLQHALEFAAEILDLEEWTEDDGGAQNAAYREASKRIRKLALNTPDGERTVREAKP